MTFLGKITRLQIQRANLKTEVNGKRVYDPAAIMAVNELILTPGGVWSRAEDGSFIADVHHRAHPLTKHRGQNPLSVLFTSHYALMQSRFGSHLALGCAGENILIECGDRIPVAVVASGLIVETAGGRVALGSIVVAPPCKPFSDYALAGAGSAPATMKSALQFLGDGMRGYYGELTGAASARVALGDSVYAATREARESDKPKTIE